MLLASLIYVNDYLETIFKKLKKNYWKLYIPIPNDDQMFARILKYERD